MAIGWSGLLTRCQTALVRVEEWLAVFSVALLLGASLAQIVARNLFHSGFALADPLGRHLVLYIAFLGAALAAAQDRHIKIDIAGYLLTPRARMRLHRPFRLLAALVCAMFLSAAVRFFHESWPAAAPNERWVMAMAVILPVGYLLLVMHFLLQAMVGSNSQDAGTP
jgi:TRAP-type C4-dicarboxylate transport system permease small subunit